MGATRNKGNSTNGSNAVAGIGIASLIHQMPMNSPTAAVTHAFHSRSPTGGEPKTATKTNGPKKRPIFCRKLYELTFWR